MLQEHWQNTLTIDNIPLGVWDTLTGGDVQASETKWKPGGMQPERSLGGSTTVNNVTLGKLLDVEDWPTLRRLMQTRTGKGRAVVARRPLDSDGNTAGDPIVYTGTLLHVTPGDTDSNSTAAQVWTVEISTNGTIG